VKACAGGKSSPLRIEPTSGREIFVTHIQSWGPEAGKTLLYRTVCGAEGKMFPPWQIKAPYKLISPGNSTVPVLAWKKGQTRLKQMMYRSGNKKIRVVITKPTLTSGPQTLSLSGIGEEREGQACRD
jgi:hypothetical protein